jgi:hypothetical protein
LRIGECRANNLWIPGSLVFQAPRNDEHATSELAVEAARV